MTGEALPGFYPLTLHCPAATATEGYLYNGKRLPYRKVETAYKVFEFGSNPITASINTLQSYCRTNNISVEDAVENDLRELLTRIILWQIDKLGELKLANYEIHYFARLLEGVRPRAGNKAQALCRFLSTTGYGSLNEFQANSSLFILTRWGIQEAITFTFTNEGVQFDTKGKTVSESEIESIWIEPLRLNRTLFAAMLENPKGFITFALPWQKQPASSFTPAFQEVSKLCWRLNVLLDEGRAARSKYSIELLTQKQAAIAKLSPLSVVVQAETKNTVGILFQRESSSYLYQVQLSWAVTVVLAYARAEAAAALSEEKDDETRAMYQQILTILEEIALTPPEIDVFLDELIELPSLLQHFIQRTSDNQA